MKNNTLRTIAVSTVLFALGFPMRSSALPATPEKGGFEEWTDWMDAVMPDDGLSDETDPVGSTEKMLEQMNGILSAMESGNAPEALQTGVRTSRDMLADNLEEMRRNPFVEGEEEEDDGDEEPVLEGPIVGIPVGPLPELSLPVSSDPTDRFDPEPVAGSGVWDSGVVEPETGSILDEPVDSDEAFSADEGYSSDGDDSVFRNPGQVDSPGTGRPSRSSSSSVPATSDSSPSKRDGKKTTDVPGRRSSPPLTWGSIRGEEASGGAIAGTVVESGEPSSEDDRGDENVFAEGADAISFDLLQWKYGGFTPATNCVQTAVQLSDLRMSRDGLGFSYVRDLSDWGLSHDDYSEALACLFVLNDAGEWVGGKFDWISSSRNKRDFKNVYSGYNGWSLVDVPNPCPAAFVIVHVKGKRRSNVIGCMWER